MNKFDKRIILASASPRRKDILVDMGLSFEIKPSDVDESRIKAVLPFNLVKKLARAKAESALNVSDGATVISADTIVAKGLKVYGKPIDEQDAVNMIGELNGRHHSVYTGVCVACGDKKIVFCIRSRVKFKDLTREQIQDYVRECKPLDKAGAYGIQDDKVVEKYKGSYTNIVGLPKEKLAEVLKRVGVM